MIYCNSCGKLKGKFNEETGEKNIKYCDNICCSGHLWIDLFWNGTYCSRCGQKQSSRSIFYI